MGKQGPCCHCGVASTPLWRNGPPEKPVLCNACGSRWRTKGTLVNYTPLHLRAVPDGHEDHRYMRMKSISLKKRDEKPNKRKLSCEYALAQEGDYTPDNNQGYQKYFDEDTSNRSSSGSAGSNLESCAQFGSADASDLTGPTQSAVWDSLVPSRKRTCKTRPKQSPVEKLTKDLYTIFHEQASQFSGTSEEDLLFDREAPVVSVEIGHGSVLIRHPSSMAREEESEASSLSVDNKLCKADESYSNAASLLSLNHSKSINNFRSLGEDIKRLNGTVMQLGQVKRDKYNHEKFQILCNHKSPLSYTDLTEIVNFDVFQAYLTDSEKQDLLKYSPSPYSSAGSDSLKSMFSSVHFKENLSSFQQLLAEGVLDSSLAKVEAEEYKVLKKLAFSNLQKCKWVECYNTLKCKGAIESTAERISKSGAKSGVSNTMFNVKRLGENGSYIVPEDKSSMKSPNRLVDLDYKNKEHLQNEASYITPTSRNVFALQTDDSSLILDSMQYEDEISDQDVLLDVPSNCSFPEAELLRPASSSASHQASASSSSLHPSRLRH